MNEADDRNAHTILIREVRSIPTTREKKVSSKASSASASLAEDALSKAFPMLHHENDQQRKARIGAFQSCWSGLSAHLKDVLEKATTTTFRELGAYAKAQHVIGVKAAFGRRRLVPTALAVAGSMNSADHAGTFSALVAYLQEQGCHAGLLQHQDLAANKGISNALNSIMRQFSGLDTEACDMEALQAWHADEIAESRPPVTASQGLLPGASSPARSPAKRPKPTRARQLQSPSKRRQLDAGAHNTRSRSAQQGAACQVPGNAARDIVSDSEEDDIVVHLSDDNSSSSEEEPVSDAQPGPSYRADSAAGEALPAASCKPLVIVIENTEAADLSTLQDLILVLSEARAQLPVTLVLGMSISVAALRHMLPVKAADVLQAKEFRLVQAKTLLESVVGEVLLGQRFHGLLFHHRLLDALLHHFLSHDFSMTCIRQGLQVACLRHFQSEPLSALTPAAAEGPEALAQACERLPVALRNSLTGSAARQSVARAAAAWRCWAVSIRWLHAAAQALGMGHSAASDGFSLTSLYVDTSDPAYMASGATGQKRLRNLCAKLEELSDDRCRQLLQALLRSCEQVVGGAEAVKEDLACIKSLLEEAEASQGVSSTAAATPQLQQQQRLGSADVPPVTPGPARRESFSLASMLKKQKAPLSGAQRKQELLGGHMKGKEGACTSEARGLGMRHQQKPRLAVRIAGLLQKIISGNLAKPPTSLAGAKALCCSAYAEVKEMMSSVPRWAVHQALAERTPANYTARQAPAQQLGIAPDMEDSAIAYRLLLEYGESVGVADWFQSFCAVFHACMGAAEAEEASPSSKAPRRRSKKQQQGSSQTAITKYMPGRRRGQQTLSPILESAAEAVTEESAVARRKTRGRVSKARTGEGKSDKPEAAVREMPEAPGGEPVSRMPALHQADKAALQDLAVRFSCASRELQFLGLIKESSRSRKDGTVQRLAYPMRVQPA